MRRYILIGICILCMGLMAGEGFAQTAVRKIGFPFLDFPTSARTEALGTAGVGLIGSGGAILYNPAGLAFMEGRELSFTNVDWIYKVRNRIGNVAANVPHIGTFALSVVNFDTGPFETVQVGGIQGPFETGPFEIGNIYRENSGYAISGAYGFKITNQFAVGTTLKLIHQNYSEYTQNVFAFDLGTYFVTGFRNAVMSVGVQNWSTGMLGEPEQWGLPKYIRLGGLVDLISIMNFRPLSHALDFVVDVKKSFNTDDPTELNLGVEYKYTHQVADYLFGASLRRGQKLRSSSWNKTDKNITWGGGLHFKTKGGLGLKVDYAHKFFNSFFDVFDERVHILSVAFNF